MKLGRAVLVAVLLCSLAEASWADKKTETEARTYYDQGTKYYALGRFEEAIQNYEKAFELRPDPVLLYNIAQAYRLSKNFERALFFYKSFLRNAPDAPNRAQIEERIAELEEWVAKQQVTANAPPVGTAEPEGDGRASIPSPDETAEAGDEADDEADTTPAAPAPRDGGGSRPIYKKWWFWAGIGAVAIGTTAIVIATTGDDGSSAPDAHFPVRSAF